jgi:hypothetical protein
VLNNRSLSTDDAGNEQNFRTGTSKLGNFPLLTGSFQNVASGSIAPVGGWFRFQLHARRNCVQPCEQWLHWRWSLRVCWIILYFHVCPHNKFVHLSIEFWEFLWRLKNKRPLSARLKNKRPGLLLEKIRYTINRHLETNWKPIETWYRTTNHVLNLRPVNYKNLTFTENYKNWVPRILEDLRFTAHFPSKNEIAKNYANFVKGEKVNKYQKCRVVILNHSVNIQKIS